jgi:competence protein ComEC
MIIVKKRIQIIFLITLMVISFTGCLNDAPTITEGQLKIHYIDVGQGDAILIQQENQNLLIDAGDNQYGDVVVQYLKEKGITELQYVIGTHPHADHIGGLDDVLYAFDVKEIFMPKVTHTSKTFEDVLIAIQEAGLSVTSPKVGSTYELGEANWTIIAPSQEVYSNLNDYSIGIKVVFGEQTFIFTGDAEKTSEDEIIQLGRTISLKSDILKVGHHGSSSSTSDEFLKAVNPEYAIIQVGADNKYGHPHKEIISKLETNNIQVYRTDLHGTIIVTSDGQNITFETSRLSDIARTETSPTTVSYENEEEVIYIGNKNSQIFHREICSSLPAEHNRIYFETREEAIEEGQSPCQRCQP